MLCITALVASCLRLVGASKHTLPSTPAPSYPSANRCKLQVNTVYYKTIDVVDLQLQVQSFKAEVWNSPNAPTNMTTIHHRRLVLLWRGKERYFFLKYRRIKILMSMPNLVADSSSYWMNQEFTLALCLGFMLVCLEHCPDGRANWRRRPSPCPGTVPSSALPEAYPSAQINQICQRILGNTAALSPKVKQLRHVGQFFRINLVLSFPLFES